MYATLQWQGNQTEIDATFSLLKYLANKKLIQFTVQEIEEKQKQAVKVKNVQVTDKKKEEPKKYVPEKYNAKKVEKFSKNSKKKYNSSDHDGAKNKSETENRTVLYVIYE